MASARAVRLTGAPMIPSLYKLKLSAAVPFTGKKKHGVWTTVVEVPADRPQWAIRVGKRIDARAVVRNRLRRQLNQWLYREKDKLLNQQFLVIVRKKPSAIDIVMNELKQFLFK